MARGAGGAGIGANGDEAAGQFGRTADRLDDNDCYEGGDCEIGNPSEPSDGEVAKPRGCLMCRGPLGDVKDGTIQKRIDGKGRDEWGDAKPCDCHAADEARQKPGGESHGGPGKKP